MPRIYAIRGGMAITRMPKIMHKMASTGFETVMPIFFKPFSTTSVNLFHLLSVAD